MTHDLLGHHLTGTGESRVVVMNDWIGDVGNWDPVLPLVDRNRFTWATVDLRGYGRSRAIAGRHDLVEASDDVLRLADELGWRRFSVIGHSMSTLVALHLGQVADDRIDRIVIVAPATPTGIGADDATTTYLHEIAVGDSETRTAGLNAMWGDRLSAEWVRFKAERWARSADPSAVDDYVDMFAQPACPSRHA